MRVFQQALGRGKLAPIFIESVQCVHRDFSERLEVEAIFCGKVIIVAIETIAVITTDEWLNFQDARYCVHCDP